MLLGYLQVVHMHCLGAPRISNLAELFGFAMLQQLQNTGVTAELAVAVGSDVLSHQLKMERETGLEPATLSLGS